MLSDSDIHRLTGLLALISESEDVEIELGSFVYDEATESRRDIDITILYRGNTGRAVMKGIEVKNHSTRPLDSTHVEQLVQKMNDMPDLVEKGIVSASGYTKPAIRKAAHHGVELFELVDWNPEVQTFDFVLPGKFPVFNRRPEWSLGPRVTLNPNKKTSDAVKEALLENPEVRFGGNLEKRDVLDLNSFSQSILKIAQGKILETLNQGNDFGKPQKPTTVQVTIVPIDAPRFRVGETWEIVEEVLLRGQVRWIVTENRSEYKILRKRGDQEPLSGCVVTEFDAWGLIGLSFSNEQRTISILNVPASVREKTKVIAEKLRSIRSNKRIDDNDSGCA